MISASPVSWARVLSASLERRMGSFFGFAHTVPKEKPTELPHFLAALKTPFTSILCDIPKHNKDYLKS